MLYVGANDGMLHGFNADTGAEVFAYIPNEVYSKLETISSTQYGCREVNCLAHEYLVDGTPTIGDAYIDDEWHSILLGSLGKGGKGLFAIDVTDPASFSTDSATDNILWELSSNHLSSSNNSSWISSPDADPNYNYADDIGYSIPSSSMVRLHDGSWAAVVANGYGSANHKAVLFLIDLSDGSLIQAINTQQGSSGSPNGLSSPIPVDTNRDRITDYIYAGDLHGNLWKFDVSDPAPSNWSVAYTDNSNPAPLFTACETVACTKKQTITAKPQVGKHPAGGLMVYFGTGQYFDVSDNVMTNSPDIHTWYGIHDNGSQVTSLDDLIEQTILHESTVSSDLRARITSNNVVDASTKKGWYMKLLSGGTTREGERITSKPLLRRGRLIVSSVIPPRNECLLGGSGWVMEVNALDGKRLSKVSFDLNDDQSFSEGDKVTYTTVDGDEVAEIPTGVQKPTLGLLLNTPTIINHTVKAEGKYVGGSSGAMKMFRESTSKFRGRQSWKQLR